MQAQKRPFIIDNFLSKNVVCITSFFLTFKDSNTTWHVPSPKTQEDITNENVSVPEKPQVPDDNNPLGSSTPVKKRREKKITVDKNMTEEQVYDELRKLCSGETPEEKYITKIMELGAGAGGVVTLAKVRILLHTTVI